MLRGSSKKLRSLMNKLGKLIEAYDYLTLLGHGLKPTSLALFYTRAVKKNNVRSAVVLRSVSVAEKMPNDLNKRLGFMYRPFAGY